MSRAYRSAAIVGLSQPVMFFAQLAINILLARFLTPEDIGLVAMVTAIINFATIFRELGLGTITIQRDQITGQQASNMFWLNTGFGIAVAVLVCLLAWPISRLYHEPRVAGITVATSSVFIVTGLSVQHSALLRRDMRFGLVTSVNVLSLVLSGAAGVTCAIIWRSYWAIVLFIVGRQALIMVGLWIFGGWRPQAFRRGHSTRELLKSGLDVAGFDVINYWSRNLDQLLIGRVLGADLLGLYRKGYEMLLLPVTQVRAPMTAVSLPALSRYQSMPEKLAKVFLDLVSATALLSSGVVAVMLLLVDWMVPILLGRQWLPVIPVFNGLSVIAAIQSVVGLLGLLLISTGNTRTYLQWGAWNAAGLITAFVVGIHWGLFGLIGCYAAASILMIVPSVVFCTRRTAVSAYSFLKRALVPNAVCWSLFGCAFLLKSEMMRAHLGLALASIASTVLFTLCITSHAVVSRQRYILLSSVISRLRSRDPSANSLAQVGSEAGSSVAAG